MTNNYIVFVQQTMAAKSASGTRLSHKGNGTFVFLAAEWKKKFGLPLNSRLSNEDAEGIKEAFQTVIANVAERLCSYDKVTVKEDNLYARFDKKTGLAVTGARGAITAHRVCANADEEKLAMRIRQGTLRRSLDTLNKKANWSEKEEERFNKVSAELQRWNHELERFAPVNSAECYDSEVEAREAMAQ